MHRPGSRVAVALIAIALVVAAAPVATGAVAEDPAAQQQPPDPESDTIGWEGGYWYNESVDVARENGLNDSELEAVVSRSMARVEQIRELEFQRRVPVEVISRNAYREQLGDRLENTSDEQALHSKVVLEAMLTLAENRSALAAQQSTLGGGVLGQYDPTEKTIQIVSNNESSPKMDELTLSHELFHALQDQRFGLETSGGNTTDASVAWDGIVEGDSHYVESLYQRRCDGEWACVEPTEEDSGGGSGDIHFGYYLTIFQPYSDGPSFVAGIREAEGWEGVNAVYDRPPTATEQVIHPDKYATEQPGTVSVEDASGEGWQVLEIPDASVNYDTVGEAGMVAMTLYPFWDSGREVRLQRIQSFVNSAGGEVDEMDPYNYSFRETAGWGGDRLYPYVRDDSFETNETGYVWKTVWDSSADADEFVAEYYELLDYNGAAPVEDRQGTFRIPDENPLGDAFYVNHTGSTVTIVNAPRVGELPNVRAGAAPEGEHDLSGTPWATGGDGGDDGTTTTEAPEDGGDGTTTATDGDAGDGSDGASDGNDGDGGAETTAADGAGFGPAVALAALLVGLVAAAGIARRD